jgi:hypothetical protein
MELLAEVSVVSVLSQKCPLVRLMAVKILAIKRRMETNLYFRL